MNTAFHISLPCLDIESTKDFYLNKIGVTTGRQSENWVDINLFGHQMTFNKAGKFDFNNPNYVFEGKILPSFHIGLIVDLKTWEKMYTRLTSLKLELVTRTTFLKGKKGEHTSFFIKDPNDYMLEFKTFKEANSIFQV